jgi:quinol monooxygenase YgiN
MTVEYIRYAVRDRARGEELLRAYEKASQSLDAAPECLAYELSVCEEDATSYILRIEWQSTQAHREGFRKGPHFRDFFAAIGDFVKEIQEMRHYSLTPVQSTIIA